MKVVKKQEKKTIVPSQIVVDASSESENDFENVRESKAFSVTEQKEEEEEESE